MATITRNLPATNSTGANRVYLGKDDRDTTDGNNTLDEVALYNYPLTAEAVAAHYLAGVATNFAVDLGNAIQLAFQNDGNNGQAVPPVPTGPVLSFGLTVGVGGWAAAPRGSHLRSRHRRQGDLCRWRVAV
jgi:hypothetical protein